MARTRHSKNGQTKRRPGNKPVAALPQSVAATRPTLIVIGGREDKIGDALILREVARHVGNGKIVVTDVASSDPAGIFEEYDRAFRKLGVPLVAHLAIQSRESAS